MKTGIEIRKLSEEQIQFLRDNIELLSNSELAERVEMSESTLRRRLKRIGIVRQKRVLELTPEAEASLRAHYATTTNVQLGADLGVSCAIIFRWGKQLGLKKDRKKTTNNPTGLKQLFKPYKQVKKNDTFVPFGVKQKQDHEKLRIEYNRLVSELNTVQLASKEADAIIKRINEIEIFV